MHAIGNGIDARIIHFSISEFSLHHVAPSARCCESIIIISRMPRKSLVSPTARVDLMEKREREDRRP